MEEARSTALPGVFIRRQIAIPKRRFLMKGGMATALVICGALILGGCGSPQDHTASSQLTQAVLDEGGQPAALVSLNNAEQVLTARCMNNLGDDFYPSLETMASSPSVLVTPEANTSVGERLANGYGIYSAMVQEAAQLGSSSGGHSVGAPATNKEILYVEGLKGLSATEYGVAVFGSNATRETYSVLGSGTISVPTKGCFATARVSIYGSIANYVAVFYGLPSITTKVEVGVLADTAYRVVVKKWSQCMKSSGYAYSAPNQAQQGIAMAYSRSGLTPTNRGREILVSTADLRCAQKSQLELNFHSALERALSKLSSSLQRQELVIVQLQTKALSRAKRLLSK